MEDEHMIEQSTEVIDNAKPYGTGYLVIRSKHGTVLSGSRNLRGIRTAVGKYVVEHVSIARASRGAVDGGGWLEVLFKDAGNGRYNGATFRAHFASFEVLRNFVRNWRNVYGAALIVDGAACGVVEYRNAALVDGAQ
jgi:hypothetical protein